MSRSPARAGVAASIAVLVTSLLVSCESTVEQTAGRPMPPEPRPAPKVPEGARPNSMAVMLVGPKPADTNGNGFPDLIAVEAYLFAEPVPTPLWADGAFVFELFPLGQTGTEGVEPIATWRIEGDRLLASRSRTLVGPGYRIGLSLLENGTDVLPVRAVDLSSAFEPADDGPTIRVQGVRTVQIIPLNASGR